MIPRIHRRGASFHGATLYVLHDAGQKQTTERVLWADTLNLGEVQPEDAWRVMMETWCDRVALKREAGVDLRGRDNTKPVLHITLSWHVDHDPTREQMMDAARASLKTLGLDRHQVLLACHNDTEHPHIHMIINTINPENGRTAPLDHSKLKLRRWADAYERDIEPELPRKMRDGLDHDPPKAKQPVKEFLFEEPERMTRQDAISHRAVIDRMRRYRAEIDHRHLVERDVSSSRHRAERQEIVHDAKSAAHVAISYVRDRFKSRWRDLYDAQRQEAVYVVSLRDKPILRAAYVMENAERLGGTSRLSWKQKQALIASPAKLEKAVAAVHNREKRMLSNVQKAETHARLERVAVHHDQKYAALAARQRGERDEQRAAQYASTSHVINYRDAKNDLSDEAAGIVPVRTAANAPPLETDAQYVERVRDDMKAFYLRNAGPDARLRMDYEPDPPAAAPQPPEQTLTTTFDQAAKPRLTRAERVKQAMAAYRTRHSDKDFDHEP